MIIIMNIEYNVYEHRYCIWNIICVNIFLPAKKKICLKDLIQLISVTSIILNVQVVKSRRMRWAGHLARMEEDRGVHRVLVRKPEGKRTLGRPRRRWENNIKMHLQEVGGCRGD
jgi:hypothetical protein